MRFKKLGRRGYGGVLVIVASLFFLLTQVGLPFLPHQNVFGQDTESTIMISGMGFIIGTYLLVGPLAALIAMLPVAAADVSGGCTGCAGGGGGGGGPPSPTIAYSPTSFSFTATKGGSNPASQTLSIWNSGGDTLDWDVSDDATWLSLSPKSGSSIGQENDVVVSVDRSSLSAGTYNATITISDPGATNTSQTVSVSLTVIFGEPPQPPVED